MRRRLKIPDAGLTKEQLKEFAAGNKSICFLVDNVGKEVSGDTTFPDFVLEEIKEIKPEEPHEIIIRLHPESRSDLDTAWDKQFTYTDAINLVKAGEANERLQATQENFDIP